MGASLLFRLFLLFYAIFAFHTVEATTIIPQIPPPPAISMPVWSLTCSTGSLLQIRKDNGDNVSSNDDTPLPTTSMNILTFCTPVSVAAPKLFVISLYYNTLTKDSFLASGQGILQLLRPSQKILVPILGKRSGYESGFSKGDTCTALGFTWATTSIGSKDKQPIDILPNCAAYIQVKLVNTIPAGDHLVTLCELVQSFEWRDGTLVPTSASAPLDSASALYTGQLRQEGII
jgi:flavin reductase (DIM6/NTAB) family NADH-FMN oxidoreductase RutF